MPRGVPDSTVLVSGFVIFLSGCGGGGGGRTQPPPPPQPDFTIGLSTSTVNIAQGSSSASVSVIVHGLNGFSGSVQVTLSGVPAGVTSNPASPFSVSSGQAVAVIIGASPNSATGQFTVSAQASSGILSHSAPFSLTVQTGVALNLPRSTFLRNDSVAAAAVFAGTVCDAFDRYGWLARDFLNLG